VDCVACKWHDLSDQKVSPTLCVDDNIPVNGLVDDKSLQQMVKIKFVPYCADLKYIKVYRQISIVHMRMFFWAAVLAPQQPIMDLFDAQFCA
jgi:hypothetical protein